SRNVDANPRYTPYTVKNVHTACPVDKNVLKTLTVEKKRLPRDGPKAAGEAKQAGSASVAKLTAKGGSTTTKSGRGDRKGRSTNTKSGRDGKKGGRGGKKGGRSGKKDEPDGAEPKPLKTLFQKGFKTVTLTLGCFTGCLQRATRLNQNDARKVADRLETAVNILSRTRIFVFKAVELKLLRCVQSEDQETSSEDQEMSSEDQETSSEDQEMTSEDELDLLDFILDKVHGTNLTRNLVARC
ncbi:hypothetical protein BGZ98_006434, partial [Dissophora globulifera]